MTSIDWQRVDLLRLAERFSVRPNSLKRVGKGYKCACICGRHQDSDPSVYLMPNEGRFKCYTLGCEHHGNAANMVMAALGCSYREAVAWLRREGYLLGEHKSYSPASRAALNAYERAVSTQDAFREVLESIAQVFHEHLLALADKHPVRQFVAQRGITEESLRRFRLGWASAPSQYLPALIKRWGEEKLQAVGLLNEQQRPVFFRRLIFPITDAKGLSYLVGRRVEMPGEQATHASESPKYLGLNATAYVARSPWIIRGQSDMTILVEGPIDAIACAQCGASDYANIIALLGLADRSLPLLLHQGALRPRVIVALDQDEAGLQAAQSVAELLRSLGAQVAFLCSADAPDPAQGMYPVIRTPFAWEDPGDFIQLGNAQQTAWLRAALEQARAIFASGGCEDAQLGLSQPMYLAPYIPSAVQSCLSMIQPRSETEIACDGQSP